jgi:hypothetical protein
MDDAGRAAKERLHGGIDGKYSSGEFAGTQKRDRMHVCGLLGELCPEVPLTREIGNIRERPYEIHAQEARAVVETAVRLGDSGLWEIVLNGTGVVVANTSGGVKWVLE